jgi:hypothetical protein
MGLLTVKVRMPWSPRERGENHERDADAEIARNLWRNYRLLPPMSPRRNMYEWLLVLLVVFNSLEIPLILTFNLPGNAAAGIKVFDNIVDALFWLDIVLILNTSYYIEEELVTSRKKIFLNYLFGWYAALPRSFG